MRHSLLFSLLCTAACLAGCAGEKDAEAAHKSAAVSGRREVVLRLAHAAEEGGDAAGAEKMYRQLAAQNQDSVDARIELSDFFKRQHKESEAVSILADTLKAHPADAHA